MTVLDCPACRGVRLDRGELEKIATSLDGDDHRERGPDGRPRGSRLSRLMYFFS